MQIEAYAFDGAIYCPACLDNPKECVCVSADRDENGLCQANCHGYGPNPIFSTDECLDDEVCDSCGAIVREAYREDEG